jgi:hypothetical protein
MENILSLIIQYWPWPIVTLLGMFVFRGSISKLLGNVKSFKAGSVEVDFDKHLRQQGLSEEQSTAFKSLSSTDIDLFLLISYSDDPSFNYQTPMAFELLKESMLRLQSSGLVSIINPEDPGTNLRHSVTPLGRRIRALLVSTCTTLLQRES